MDFFWWLTVWYNEHGAISLPPLPLFDGITPDGLPLDSNPDRENNEGTIAPGEPIPVEPNGGIGDGAQPLPGAEGSGDGDDKPIPIESDGGIGDGAGPIPTDGDGTDGRDEDTKEPSDTFDTIVDGGGEGTAGNDLFQGTSDADIFIFASGQGYDAIVGFDQENDTLDLSETVFTNVKDVIAAASDTIEHVAAFNQLDDGVVIKTGEGAYGYIEGLTLEDLEKITIIFAE